MDELKNYRLTVILSDKSQQPELFAALSGTNIMPEYTGANALPVIGGHSLTLQFTVQLKEDHEVEQIIAKLRSNGICLQNIIVEKE